MSSNPPIPPAPPPIRSQFASKADASGSGITFAWLKFIQDLWTYLVNLTFGNIAGKINISQINATGTPSAGTFLCGDASWSPGSGGGSGTVTSVAMEGDGVVFNSVVPGSPIDSAGTLAPTRTEQLPNLFLASNPHPLPIVLGATEYRKIVAADEPATTVNSVTDDANVTGSITDQDLTLGWAGLLALDRGGTDADLSATGGASQVLKQTTVGGAISVAQLSYSDISGSVPAPGSTNQILYNNAGALGASSKLTWDGGSVGIVALDTVDGGTFRIGQILTDYQGISCYGNTIFTTGLTDPNLYFSAPAGGSVYLESDNATYLAHLDATGNFHLPGELQITSASGPTWSSGSGAPSGTPAIGSIYSRTSGGVGSSFYVYNGTAWVAVA